ncbi:MAG: fatty acid desaturase [Acidobacteriia bacterium]|nr:fatty acid desaturase [Terriglobia bacterium]
MKRINWPTAVFLLATPIAAVAAVSALLALRGFRLADLVLLVVFAAATGLSVTAGYHRLFAHRAYDAIAPVRIAFLLVGAGAFQQSVLDWSADHRRHHKNVDDEADPYNINRGFLWAHIGWLLVADTTAREFSNVPDLLADRWVVLQHRFYLPLALLMGFGAPLAAGYALGSPWGGIVWGGLVRVVVVHHATFFVNSLAHTLGRRPYTTATSARDSFVTALLTFGEGYHNFHHRFAADYRNGVRTGQYDPTKWLIRLLAAIRLAWNLKTVPRERIVAAEVECARERLTVRLRGHAERISSGLLERFGEMSAALHRASLRLAELERARARRAEIRAARRELRRFRREWRAMVAALEQEARVLPA